MKRIYKVLPKSAEKESGSGQPCMTNPPLTPSVPLSTSKDKSCTTTEYFHVIMPSTCVGYITKHDDFKNQTTIQLKPVDQLSVGKEGNDHAMWRQSAALKVLMGVNPYTTCKVTFRNTL